MSEGKVQTGALAQQEAQRPDPFAAAFARASDAVAAKAVQHDLAAALDQLDPIWPPWLDAAA